MTQEVIYTTTSITIVCIGLITVFIRNNYISIFMGFFSATAGVVLGLASMASNGGENSKEAELFAFIFLMVCFVIFVSALSVMYSRSKNGVGIDEIDRAEVMSNE